MGNIYMASYWPLELFWKLFGQTLVSQRNCCSPLYSIVGHTFALDTSSRVVVLPQNIPPNWMDVKSLYYLKINERSNLNVEEIHAMQLKNGFVSIFLLHFQKIWKGKLFKHKDYKQAIIFQITVLGIGTILTSFGKGNIPWKQTTNSQGSQPSIKKMLKMTPICHFNVFHWKTSINI